MDKHRTTLLPNSLACWRRELCCKHSADVALRLKLAPAGSCADQAWSRGLCAAHTRPRMSLESFLEQASSPRELTRCL